MKLIDISTPTFPNTFSKVDDADFDLINRRKWQPIKGKTAMYARCRANKDDAKMGDVLMHRLIMNAPQGVQVDHRDGDGLNNQRSNLRLCSNTQNQWNQRVHANPKTSRFKGLYFNSSDRRWLPAICVNGKRRRLGSFVSEIDAAKAYNVAALEAFGEFARLNEV